MTHDTEHNVEDERFYLRQARELSHKWGDRLDNFVLPCPLCKGELHFQGVYRDRLYEFAEDEPGVVNPLDVLPISFICNRCGFTAEFDSELFNPAYLAQLEGAGEEEIADLQLHDYRVLIPLRGNERSDTLFKIGTALAGEQTGDVLVLNIGANGAESLEEKVQHFIPAPGNPAPQLLETGSPTDLRSKLAEVAAEQKCNLLLIDSRNWMPSGLTPVTDAVTMDVVCDVGVVHDRGLKTLHRILLVTGGGPNAKAAAPMAVNLAQAFEAELHFLVVLPTAQAHLQAEGKRRILEMLGNLKIPVGLRVEYRMVVSDHSLQTIVEESGRYDLLILGASNRDWRGRVRPDSIAIKIARNTGTTSLLVRARGSLIKTWVNRLLG